MKRSIFVLAVLASVVVGGRSASAANPFRDRHFVHYQLTDYYDLQDANRYTWGLGYQTTPWSGDYPGQTPRREPIVAPELPPVPLPSADYEYRRYEYYRSLIPGSPAAYPPPKPLNPVWESSPSDMVSPFRSKTGQPGSDAYAP